MSMKASQINIKNRRATFDYEILERFIAGIQLAGTEIKSIREGRAGLVDTFCYFAKGDLWVKGMRVSEYFYGTYNNHQPDRDRKLLLHKKEIDKLIRKTKESGLTIVPLRLFITEKGYAKLEIGLTKGKKMHEKRETLRSADAKREIDRVMKKF